MKLSHGLHLAYCTNVHRGASWGETLDSLKRFTLSVRDRVCPGKPYAIGLRLGADAARELSDSRTLSAFRKWLDAENCYVFTINGFPYGQFHGTRVKEQVYLPDWTSPDRLEYTKLLFDLLGEIVPEGIEGSVSTLPGSFKEFITTSEQVQAMRENLWSCVEHIADVSRRTGKALHLGLEPEPLCFLENRAETVCFYEQMRDDRPCDHRLDHHLGVNYDACHLAIQFEEPQQVFRSFQEHGIKVSKLHLSSALSVVPTREVCRELEAFADTTYLHQVVSRDADGVLRRYKDLDVALQRGIPTEQPLPEWRVHFHIPLHSPATAMFGNTTDHLLKVLDFLQQRPEMCSHLEMETYTWEVMPPELKHRNVVDQLVGEYEWTLARLRERGLAP